MSRTALWHALDGPPEGLPEPVEWWWRVRLHRMQRTPLQRVDALPEPAKRWLSRAVAPEAPAGGVAQVTQQGQIRLGAWRSFTATCLLAPDGFVWAATTKIAGLPVRGFDRYTDDCGEMRWRLFGRLPLIHAEGEDVTRSAAGRLAGELVFDPVALLAPGVRWEPLDAGRAVAHVPAGARTIPVTVTVVPDGRLARVELPRWGDPDGAPPREHLFTAEFGDAELTADGITVPAEGRAGWWRCPDRCADEEFFRFQVVAAEFR